jgi:(2Fe-2S) ferredoxin
MKLQETTCFAPSFSTECLALNSGPYLGSLFDPSGTWYGSKELVEIHKIVQAMLKNSGIFYLVAWPVPRFYYLARSFASQDNHERVVELIFFSARVLSHRLSAA